MLKIYQDGNRFYANGRGLLYTAPVQVKDFDIDAANRAKVLFEEWAKRNIHRCWTF